MVTTAFRDVRLWRRDPCVDPSIATRPTTQPRIVVVDAVLVGALPGSVSQWEGLVQRTGDGRGLPARIGGTDRDEPPVRTTLDGDVAAKARIAARYTFYEADRCQVP